MERGFLSPSPSPRTAPWEEAAVRGPLRWGDVRKNPWGGWHLRFLWPHMQTHTHTKPLSKLLAECRWNTCFFSSHLQVQIQFIFQPYSLKIILLLDILIWNPQLWFDYPALWEDKCTIPKHLASSLPPHISLSPHCSHRSVKWKLAHHSCAFFPPLSISTTKLLNLSVQHLRVSQLKNLQNWKVQCAFDFTVSDNTGSRSRPTSRTI